MMMLEINPSTKINKNVGFTKYETNYDLNSLINQCRNFIDNADLNKRKGTKKFVKDDFINVKNSTTNDPYIKLALDMDIVSIVS